MSTTIDHLVYGCPDLETGQDHIERLCGVRPRYGGQHLGLGTHNALIALGPTSYLELIAPDPSQDAIDGELPFGLDRLESPSLRAWAASPDDFDRAVRTARRAGFDVGEVVEHTRRLPDGKELRWRMTTSTGPGTGVAVRPFLIEWGDGGHPARTSPAGVQLGRLKILSPDAIDTADFLRAVGLEILSERASEPAIEAEIVTASGEVVVLRS